MKKIICLVLSLVMAFSMISVSAFAEGETCGDIVDPIDAEVMNCYAEYLKEHNAGGYLAIIVNGLIKYDKYVVFFGDYGGPEQDIEVSRVVDNYLVTNSCKGVPYDLGVYVYNGTEICTLEEAIDRKYFKMSDIGDLSSNFIKLSDYTEEDILKEFTEYVHTINGSDWDKTITCEIIGQHYEYVIFHGSDGVFTDESVVRIVDNYYVNSDVKEHLYDIGIFVYNGKSICTLKSAVDRKYFKMEEVSNLSERFAQKACNVDQERITFRFKEYLDKHNESYHDEPYATIIAVYDDYIIFEGSNGIASPTEVTKTIQNYSVYSPNIEYPYDLGIYVYKVIGSKEVCTLEEAINSGYFNMSDIAHFSDRFKKVYDIDTETLSTHFAQYLEKLGKDYEDSHSISIVGQYGEYVIFNSSYNGEMPQMVISGVIDNYVVVVPSPDVPYELGLYVFNGTDVCTLSEAVEKKYFKMADISHLSNSFTHIFDVNDDGKLDMEDAVTIQRIAAGLQRECDYYYYIINQNSHMNAVVKVQQYVAKLITVLS